MRLAWLLVSAMMLTACRSKEDSGPPIPASADPEGKDLVVGAVVIATEDTGGVRIYKIKEVSYFPPPVGDELVMLAFQEKGADFPQAAKLWSKRELTVALPSVRVARHQFAKNRDYRVIATEPVSKDELALKRDDKLPPIAAKP